ncbi:histidine phosphatase family protein [Pseudonocardia sp. HH130630-07]|uniref:histidine phosphatase family protein n=1 Tax=Pseudonocardia sp. HH130630-07 TaxID=1690815 RepID=UPI000839B414|nr:histidine phosphatase family protein [Pseudonocardia sp. HH130630-07]
MNRGSARITFVVHAATAGTRVAAFPAGEPAAPGAVADLAASPPLRADRHRHAPDPASASTCAALGRDGSPDRDLRDWDAGRWSGRTLGAVAAAEPAGLRSWLDDPAAAPHGGESLLDLLERVSGWLGGAGGGHTVAVCGPAVARAAVVLVLGAPPAGFWRIDAGPLTVTDLRGGPDRWTVRASGQPLRGAATESRGTR